MYTPPVNDGKSAEAADSARFAGDPDGARRVKRVRKRQIIKGLNQYGGEYDSGQYT